MEGNFDSTDSVLLLTKPADSVCSLAFEVIRQKFREVTWIEVPRGGPLPSEVMDWRGDLLISFLCPVVIPGEVLGNSTKAINFHPAPPEFPGIGCSNLAIYEGAREFGVTCHEMDAAVDSGRILQVRRFPIERSDTVYSLTLRSYLHLLQLLEAYLDGRCEIVENESWTRRPSTRKDLEALCEVLVEMDEKEVTRRIRSVDFPGAPGAFVVIHGHVFEWVPERSRINYAAKTW